MKKLMKYMKGYGKQATLAPLFKLMEALMDLFVPLVVAWIINRGILAGNKAVVTQGFTVMILLAAAGLGFSITAQYFAARASVGFASRIRQVLFDHVESLSYTELDTLGTDTLITRMTSDVNQVQTGVNMALRLLLRSPFIVFGSMIMAFTIDVKCALIFVVAIPVLAVVVFGIMAASIPLFRKVQAALDDLLGITRENLTGVRVIRAFCKEESEIREYDAKNDQLTQMNLFVGRLSALMNPATYFLINLATIVLISRGAIQVNLGSIQQGQVVALYNYMAQMIVELIKLASLIITINKALACADRVATVLDVENGMAFPEVSATSADAALAASGANNTFEDAGIQSYVEFRGVSFQYAGAGAESVSNIDFTARKGQTIGIIGGTGSGKSTVVNLIPRFYDATKGEVLLDGNDVREYTEEDLRSKIGVIPQKAMLFKGTIRDNMKWGNENATDEEIMEAIKTAQAEEVVAGKDGGLDAVVEQNGRNFSGGQKQRLTIARAIVKNPDILIMDDSASALDFATDARLRKAIRGLNDNRQDNPMTVFIVSQRASSIMNADQILVLSDGEIAGKGTHEELMKSCDVYQEIYYSQFPEKRPGASGKADGIAGAQGADAALAAQGLGQQERNGEEVRV